MAILTCIFMLLSTKTLESREKGQALGERDGLSVHDAMIVAAAMLAGCERLLSEEMRHRVVTKGRLRIVDPFRDAEQELPPPQS